MTTLWIECDGQGPSARECLTRAAEKRGLSLLSIVIRDGQPVVRTLPFSLPEWLCEVELKEDK